MDDAGVRKVLKEMVQSRADILHVDAGGQTFTLIRPALDDTGIRWIESGHRHWMPYHAITHAKIMETG